MAERTMLTLYTHTDQPVPYPQPQGKAKFNQTTGEGVSWAGWTWGPITGCLRGCDHCYARSITARWPDAFPAGFEPLFHDERLPAPYNTTIPKKHRGDPAFERVFVCSMADMLGYWVPEQWINQILVSEHANPQWEYLHLTEYPSRYHRFEWPASAWLGTTVKEQNQVRLAEEGFAKITQRVKVRWLSLEPLEQHLQFSDLSVWNWVVIGARTATVQPNPVGFVPAFDPPAEWVLSITEQAKAAGCAVHWKPNLRNSLRGITAPGEPGWFDEYPTNMRRLAA